MGVESRHASSRAPAVLILEQAVAVTVHTRKPVQVSYSCCGRSRTKKRQISQLAFDRS